MTTPQHDDFGIGDGPCPDDCQHCAVADGFLATVAARQPVHADRFATCQDDCTTDCGRCKGHGRPTPMQPTTIGLLGENGDAFTPLGWLAAADVIPITPDLDPDPDREPQFDAADFEAAWDEIRVVFAKVTRTLALQLAAVTAFFRSFETPRQRELREHREKVARREAAKDPAATATWSAYRAKRRRSNRRRNRG
ncbi:hypothetical protein [Oerskovia jenensis]|uniref:hypothetical protein n=1 Tax=Oerskovia jenensis TaxID=162169 RepID=UPI0036DD8ABB